MRRKTIEEFKEIVFNLVGEEYEVIGDYENNKTKISIRHNVCGHFYEVLPKNFIIGNRCPKCAKNSLKSLEKLKKEIYNLVGNEYEVIGEYNGTVKPINIKHNICKKEYSITPNNFLRGNRCNCRNNQ